MSYRSTGVEQTNNLKKNGAPKLRRGPNYGRFSVFTKSKMAAVSAKAVFRKKHISDNFGRNYNKLHQNFHFWIQDGRRFSYYPYFLRILRKFKSNFIKGSRLQPSEQFCTNKFYCFSSLRIQ